VLHGHTVYTVLNAEGSHTSFLFMARVYAHRLYKLHVGHTEAPLIPWTYVTFAETFTISRPTTADSVLGVDKTLSVCVSVCNRVL